MSWNRLELHARSKDLDPGLQADVADPLWMLARQWQFGEFQGQDAGSPVAVNLEATTSLLSAYRISAPGKPPSGAYAPLPDAPLEAVVESEAVVGGPSSDGLAAEAGLHLFRILAGTGLPDELKQQLRSLYPFATSAPTPEDEETRTMALLLRRSLDARLLDEALGDPAAIPTGLSVPAGLESQVLSALQAWSGWYRGRFAEFEGEHWQPSRMEYTFEAVAKESKGHLIVEAGSYADGRLEWTDFDLRRQVILSSDVPLTEPFRTRRRFLPQQARFRGMPVSRFWEFEDRKVYLGDIDAGPTDLIRLLMVEFALIAGDDWFSVPLDAPFGSLSRVDALEVTNTFEETVSILPATTVDGPSSPWKMFVLSGDPAVETGRGRPWLFLVPSLAKSLNGAAIEQVAFIRDEMANLAWAVERRIEGPLGNPLDLHERWLAEQSPPPEPPTMTTYELMTQVPPHWFPLVPVQADDQRSIRLRRGRLLRSLDESLVEPRGRVLMPGQPLRMHEEEVPRAGMKVERSWQLGRWHDGSTWLWVGRKKSVGKSQRASNLTHDRLVEPPED